MSDVRVFAPGGYRFINAVFQYSGGVAAEPGFEIERVRLAGPVPLQQGYALIESHLATLGRPSTAFCACELRSPAPFSEQGFIDFNREYVQTLARWGIYADEVNPVARTNVCPAHHEPAQPMLYAFSYTVPSAASKAAPRPSFIIAGGGEAREVQGSFREQIVRYQDRSADGMREKVRYVMAEMTRRLQALGFDWSDALSTQAYTVYDIGACLEDEIVRPGAANGGLSWFFCRPPVEGLDFEMDVRAPTRELVI
ncbi:MAG: hypothetical protein KDK91_28495 [Gammaproteobacteria bacterium]|nr:hypothetical protein [Gammaproteobacteria bacterium]